MFNYLGDRINSLPIAQTELVWALVCAPSWLTSGLQECPGLLKAQFHGSHSLSFPAGRLPFPDLVSAFWIFPCPHACVPAFNLPWWLVFNFCTWIPAWLSSSQFWTHSVSQIVISVISHTYAHAHDCHHHWTHEAKSFLFNWPCYHHTSYFLLSCRN